MKLDTIAEVKEYLIKAGIIDTADETVVENLRGGVSSRVWKIMQGSNRWVVKQALEKLNVEEEWFADVDRIHREHEVMEALADLAPKGAIPKVLHVDHINHIYMMTCVEDEAQAWKDILMKQTFSVPVAENAGHLLRVLHHQSNRMVAGDKAKFQDQKYFVQLRVDPFHRFLVQKYPELSASIQKIVDEITLQKTCLVHGDFSPKNMLVKKDNTIVLIDFEVAHWGNPVFDLAYCTGHLMLKGWHLKTQQEILKLTAGFLAAYDRAPNNLIQHLGLMLLARMDGKSPVNYIKDERVKNVIRKVAINWIQGETQDSDTIGNIEKAFKTDY